MTQLRLVDCEGFEDDHASRTNGTFQCWDEAARQVADVEYHAIEIRRERNRIEVHLHAPHLEMLGSSNCVRAPQTGTGDVERIDVKSMARQEQCVASVSAGEVERAATGERIDVFLKEARW